VGSIPLPSSPLCKPPSTHVFPRMEFSPPSFLPGRSYTFGPGKTTFSGCGYTPPPPRPLFFFFPTGFYAFNRRPAPFVAAFSTSLGFLQCLVAASFRDPVVTGRFFPHFGDRLFPFFLLASPCLPRFVTPPCCGDWFPFGEGPSLFLRPFDSWLSQTRFSPGPFRFNRGVGGFFSPSSCASPFRAFRWLFFPSAGIPFPSFFFPAAYPF